MIDMQFKVCFNITDSGNVKFGKKKNAVFITITIDVDLLPQTKFFKILHDSLYVIVS